jgi:hypothetical protein
MGLNFGSGMMAQYQANQQQQPQQQSQLSLGGQVTAEQQALMDNYSASGGSAEAMQGLYSQNAGMANNPVYQAYQAAGQIPQNGQVQTAVQPGATQFNDPLKYSQLPPGMTGFNATSDTSNIGQSNPLGGTTETGQPQGNVQLPNANGEYNWEEGDAMTVNQDGSWTEPVGNESYDKNKAFILSKIQAGTATPEQQGWYDKYSWRMAQGPNGVTPDGSTVNQGSPGAVNGSTGAPPTGLIGSEAALATGLTGATDAVNAGVDAAGNTIQEGLTTATNAINAGVDAAGNALNPYTSAGNASSSLQADLSGANGPAAQQAAYDNYISSPGQAYLVEQGERAITRNSAATGGLQGGNVLAELNRHGVGMAAQDFNNSYNRLNQISDRGFNASNSLAGIQANAGSQIGSLSTQSALSQGGMQANAGQQIGNYEYNTGAAVSDGRTRAGEQIANNVQQTAAAMANLVGEQGMNMAATMAASGANLAQIAQQLGISDAAGMQQLAAFLGNISMGNATTVAGQPGVGGLVQPNTIISDTGAILSGVGSAVTAYDSNKPPATTTTNTSTNTSAPISVGTPDYVAPGA